MMGQFTKEMEAAQKVSRADGYLDGVAADCFARVAEHERAPLQEIRDRGRQPRKRWIGNFALWCVVFTTSLIGVGYTQQRSPIYPRGALLLYRNSTAPFRYATMGGSRQFRANINFNNEPIEFVLLIKGSDGNFYTNAARSRFPSTDGWVIAAGSGQIHPLELIGLDNQQSTT